MKLKFQASAFPEITEKLMDYVKPGKSYVLEIHSAKDKRSLNQNSYYWSVIVGLFSQSTGYTANEAHQELAKMFLTYERGNKQFIKSTTELNTFEFEQYAEKCRLFMYNDFNIHVPLPNETTEDFAMQLDNIYNY